MRDSVYRRILRALQSGLCTWREADTPDTRPPLQETFAAIVIS